MDVVDVQNKRGTAEMRRYMAQTFLPINLDHLQFPGALKHKMRQQFEKSTITFAFKLVYSFVELKATLDTPM